MVDKESPNYLRTVLEKYCYQEKGEFRCERSITIEGNDREVVGEAIKYLSARLL